MRCESREVVELVLELAERYPTLEPLRVDGATQRTWHRGGGGRGRAPVGGAEGRGADHIQGAPTPLRSGAELRVVGADHPWVREGSAYGTLPHCVCCVRFSSLQSRGCRAAESHHSLQQVTAGGTGSHVLFPMPST